MSELQASFETKLQELLALGRANKDVIEIDKVNEIMSNKMKLTFSALSENEAFARTAVACFIMNLDPTVEEITDIKTVKPRYSFCPLLMPMSEAFSLSFMF